MTYIQRFKKDTAMDEDFNSDPVFLPFYSGLINDREFKGNRHSIRIENYQLEKVIDQRRNLEADSIVVTLFTISKPMFDLFLSLNTPESATGDPFFDPTIIANDEKIGIAILCAYSQFSHGVKLK